MNDLPKAYVQHDGKVVETDGRFAYAMAITLDQQTKNTRGIIRCVLSREGNLKTKGYSDRSELRLVAGSSLEYFSIGERLILKGEDEILEGLIKEQDDFIGLEDPDIYVDCESGLMHVYFTIPIKPADEKHRIRIYLGHAVGKDLDSLEMTQPVLMSDGIFRAKEVSIAPKNSKGFRYNLVESSDRKNGDSNSTVRIAIAHDLGQPWEYGKTLFHPKEHSIPWIGGHASPGPLLPTSFIDIGEGKRVGIINGREANQILGEKTDYGIFSVGLFIYDYENGVIDWVSPEPLIRDSEAETITFASDFIETQDGEGILYAHVDDSFVRAYTLYAEGIRMLLP